MSRRSRKRVECVADFETTTDSNDCRVWAWGFSYLDYPDTVEYGETIEEFFERIEGERLICSFHNLKFDGMFIVYWLLVNGYRYTETAPEAGEFNTLISKMGMFYTIKVGWFAGGTVEFRDSLKKLPMPISRIASSFNMEMIKGEIDYHAKRYPGHKLTHEERAYVHNDVSILANAMATVRSQGLTKLTVGSDALAEYKTTCPQFEKLFPVLTSDVDADIRAAYRGGFTYVAERFRGKHIKRGGIVLDVNSLYPYIMYSRWLPWGEPLYHDTAPSPTKARPLTIFQVTFTAKLKPKHVPCIQLKNNFRGSGAEYLEEISEPTTISVTNVDWELYNAHYDIEVVEYGPGYSFKAAYGMFAEYIDKWSKIKAESTGGLRELAKLQLNSLYGKFATSTDTTGKYPVLEDGRVKLVTLPASTREPIYTAVGVFITAFARDYTIRAAQANYDAFAYADTDSLHLFMLGLPNLIIDNHEIGAWKIEYLFDEAFFKRPKAYMEKIYGGSLVTKVAGVPEKLAKKLTFKDMRYGKTIQGKLIPKSVPGGVVLSEVEYNLPGGRG